MYTQINKNISRYVTFEPKELEIFNSLLEYKAVLKKMILLYEGETCNFEVFVIKGCCEFIEVAQKLKSWGKGDFFNF